MAQYGESIVKKFLESKGFIINKIPESYSKTPDFEVFKEGNLVFYCEE